MPEERVISQRLLGVHPYLLVELRDTFNGTVGDVESEGATPAEIRQMIRFARRALKIQKKQDRKKK